MSVKPVASFNESYAVNTATGSALSKTFNTGKISNIAKLIPFAPADSDTKFRTKVTAVGEITTDISTILRSTADHIKGGDTGIAPMGLASGAYLIIGSMYAYNGVQDIQQTSKVGNQKGLINGILATIKGVSLTIMGSLAVVFRSLSIAGMDKAATSTGLATSVVMIGAFAVTFGGFVVKILNILGLKLKLANAGNELEQFAILSKKLFGNTTQEKFDAEVARYARLSPEEKEAFKGSLTQWIEDSKANTIRNEKNQLRALEKNHSANEDDWARLYATMTIATRKRQKLVAHFGEEKLKELQRMAKPILEGLDKKARESGFENFEDVIAHASSNVCSKYAEAKIFLRSNEAQSVTAEILTVADGAMTENLINLGLGALFFGIGGMMLISGMVLASSFMLTAIAIMWIPLSLFGLYLDVADLIADKKDGFTRNEKIALISLNAIAATVGIVSLVLSVMSGGTVPVAFAVIMLLAYATLYGSIWYNHYYGKKPEQFAYESVKSVDFDAENDRKKTQ